VATIGQLAVGGLLSRLPMRVPPWLMARTSIRPVLESRGLTYVKAGQFLSTRFDLFQTSVCRDLERLFEQVAPVRFSELRPLIEAELGCPIHETFETFDEQPIAAASVAQVHKARLKSGEWVAVKVQRPDAAQTFAADMLLFRLVAVIADWFDIGGGSISAREAVEQFRTFTTRELDFVQEGKTADRLRGAAGPKEVIPKIFWRSSTSRILTMEFIDGVSLARLYAAKDGSSGEAIDVMLPKGVLRQGMRNLARASLRQIFGLGFFHGDPHLGNILILTDGSVAFVDFGIFGELRDRERTLLRRHLEHLALGDIPQSFRFYAALQGLTGESDLAHFARDTQRIMRRWHALALDPATQIHDRLAGRFAVDMLSAMRKNNVKVDINLLLFWRVFLVLDSTALRFSSDFDLMSELRRYFEDTSASIDRRLAESIPRIDRVGQLLTLASTVCKNLGNVPHRAGDASNVRLSVHESSDLKEEKNREAKLLTLSLIMVSLVIALVGVGSAKITAIGAPVAALVIATVLFVPQRRRHRDT
jgi:ubiquinone biosynthesis protein